MDRKEFKTQKEYIAQLKSEKRDDNTATVKTKEFNTQISALVSKYPAILVRDFLDIDGTFAVAMPRANESRMTLSASVELYLDVCDIVKAVTYTQVKQTGLMQVDTTWTVYNGFWVLFK